MSPAMARPQASSIASTDVALPLAARPPATPSSRLDLETGFTLEPLEMERGNLPSKKGLGESMIAPLARTSNCIECRDRQMPWRDTLLKRAHLASESRFIHG
jgi:hypothetical protein